MFWTVLRDVRSPQNAGMLVRSHVAMGGEALVVISSEPWRFTKTMQSFSRRLEKLTELIYLPDDAAFFQWCAEHTIVPIAVEITAPPRYLSQVAFPERVAIVLGNEGTGLPQDFLVSCADIVTIPQYGPVASLNVAVAGSIVMYELNRTRPVTRPIVENTFVGQPDE